jgi:hypothetical protein
MGIDSARIPESTAVPAGCKCEVCLDVFLDPKELSKCKHIFCSGCLDNIKQDGLYKCPKCSKVNKRVNPPNHSFKQFYGDLDIHCKWKDFGCKAKCNITDDESHANLCEKNPLKDKLCEKCDYYGPFLKDGQKHDCIQYLKKKASNAHFDNLWLKKRNAQLEKEAEAFPDKIKAEVIRAENRTAKYKDQLIAMICEDRDKYFDRMTELELEKEFTEYDREIEEAKMGH